MNKNPVLDPQIRELMESAATGEAAKLFLNSELGRYLRDRADDEMTAAMDELVDCNPNDGQQIAEIQRRIKVPAQAIGWFTDAITDGDNAMKMLQDDDES